MPAWLERAQAATDLRARYHALDRSPVFLPEETAYGLRVGARRDIGEGAYYWRFTHWMMPFYNLFKQGSAKPGVNSQGIAWTPIDDHSCWTIVVTWNDVRPLSGEDIEAAEEFAGPRAAGLVPARPQHGERLHDRPGTAGGWNVHRHPRHAGAGHGGAGKHGVGRGAVRGAPRHQRRGHHRDAAQAAAAGARPRGRRGRTAWPRATALSTASDLRTRSCTRARSSARRRASVSALPAAS